MHAHRLAAITLALAAAALGACGGGGGGSDDDGGGAGAGSAAQEGERFAGAPPGEGRKGGELTVLTAGDVDYLDPGQMYYVFSYTVAEAVFRQLYFYKPGDSDTPTPDLATGPPKISDGGRTVTVELRGGARFAPPVDRGITSADIKYAFERAFSENVPSPYASVYFSDIVGAPDAPTKGVPDIDGIETPDDRTVVFRLERPSAALVASAMALPISVPVPADYAGPFDAKSPSTYDSYVAFSGPYMVRNDGEGKVVGRRAGQSIELVRNPNWTPESGDVRPAYLDRILIEEGNEDTAVAGRRVLQGSRVVLGDGAPPAQLLTSAVRQTPDQVALVSAGGWRHIALNSKIKPFDDIDVRKAVIAGFDREALRRTRGGELVGDIPTHFLPPGFPGHDEAGGMKGPGLDFLADPRGDKELMAKYFKAAGYASGKYEGKEELLMVGSNADPGKKTAEVAAQQLRDMGFAVKLRLAAQDVMYTRFCNVPRQGVAICPNVGWSKDFNDPQGMLDATFNGKNILPANNSNWSQLDDPAINEAMTKASALPPGDERDAAWGKIDQMITAQAPAIPWLWDKQPLITAKDVRAVANVFNTGWSLPWTSLREQEN
jgi:peptide/nickel transport system substrate-binding protein